MSKYNKKLYKYILDYYEEHGTEPKWYVKILPEINEKFGIFYSVSRIYKILFTAQEKKEKGELI